MSPTNRFVDEELGTLGLDAPKLKVLTPDNHPYTALIYQPQGRIRADAYFIGNEIPDDEIRHKYRSFLDLAVDVDLAITPEYSCPWSVLLSSLNNRIMPREGGLWVLGCESITPQEFMKIKENLNAVWIHETPLPSGNGNFLNPVCYVFRIASEERPIIAVQLKTEMSADHVHFLEHSHLILGTTRYVLRNDPNSIGLFSLICSDSLTFEMEQIDTRYVLHPYLVLHLQMNPKPRHADIIRYRQDCYEYDSKLCDFICLNWSSCTQAGKTEQYGGSAIFTKETLLADDRINTNHLRGLYYAYWHEKRAHVYYLNHDEFVFKLKMSKTWQNRPASTVMRPGPEELETYRWSKEEAIWESVLPDDGFEEMCAGCGYRRDDIVPKNLKPLDIDRLFSLSSAEIDFEAERDWYKPNKLKLLRTNGAEVFNRISCLPCNDFDTRGKRSYISDMATLRTEIITVPELFPEHIRDLRNCCEIAYDSSAGQDSHAYNLYGIGDQSKRSTVAYLGARSLECATFIRDRLAECLGGSKKRRLVVWYRYNNEIYSVPHPAQPMIDDDPSEGFLS